MRNMCAALIRAETIRTTVPKAKELRRVVEPLINLGKSDTLPGRRRAWVTLRDDALVVKLFEDIGPRFKTRAGGYTRILRVGYRRGHGRLRPSLCRLDLAAAWCRRDLLLDGRLGPGVAATATGGGSGFIPSK